MSYIKFKGSDLGVIVELSGTSSEPNPILFYNPSNKRVPYEGMTYQERLEIIPRGTETFTIHKDLVRRISVTHDGVTEHWHNRDYCNIGGWPFYGRGDIEIEVEPFERSEHLGYMDKELKKLRSNNIGLEEVE